MHWLEKIDLFYVTCYVVASVVLVLLILKREPDFSVDVDFNGGSIKSALAITNNQKNKGLGGASGLSSGNGMLFVFDDPASRGIWMKDMNFAIDVVWVNSSGKIISIDKSVEPETYPVSFMQDNVKFILEIPSGDADKYGLTPGQKLSTSRFR